MGTVFSSDVKKVLVADRKTASDERRRHPTCVPHTMMGRTREEALENLRTMLDIAGITGIKELPDTHPQQQHYCGTFRLSKQAYYNPVFYDCDPETMLWGATVYL